MGADMKKQTIEIDMEVFEFLKMQAEPFVDTPNDVLRRLLLSGKLPSRVAQDNISMEPAHAPPPVPAGTPKALEQILQVIYLAHHQNISRPKATKMVAEIYGVAPQTVLDKYCRQLNLTALEFDKLLSETGLHTLKNKLRSKFHGYSGLIDNYLEVKGA